jgi:hypothetical protein
MNGRQVVCCGSEWYAGVIGGIQSSDWSDIIVPQNGMSVPNPLSQRLYNH